MSMLPAMSFSAVHYVKANGTGDGSSWANAAGNFRPLSTPLKPATKSGLHKANTSQRNSSKQTRKLPRHSS